MNRPAEASITSICRGMVAIVACSLVLSAAVWDAGRMGGIPGFGTAHRSC